MATSAAIPKIIEDINSNNLDRLRRLSRQAISTSQEIFKPLDHFIRYSLDESNYFTKKL